MWGRRTRCALASHRGDLLHLESYIMGFRFRKSIKLFPGVRINLSKSGVSTSIGRPGATVNFSERGVRGTVGIPGTGMSYSENLSAGTPQPAADVTAGPWWAWAIPCAIVFAGVYWLLS